MLTFQVFSFCRVIHLAKNVRLTTVVDSKYNTGKLEKAFLNLFKVTDSYFECIKTEDDGLKGLVTFTQCTGNHGIKEENKNKFTVVKPGKYFVSLSAYIQNYEGGVFELTLLLGDRRMVSVQSDHEDDGNGFTGAGTVYSDRILYLSKNDELQLRVSKVEGGSLLNTASLNFIRLP